VRRRRRRRRRRNLIKVLARHQLLASKKLFVEILKVSSMEGTSWFADVLSRGSNEVHVEYIREPRPGNLKAPPKRFWIIRIPSDKILTQAHKQRGCASHLS